MWGITLQMHSVGCTPNLPPVLHLDSALLQWQRNARYGSRKEGVDSHTERTLRMGIKYFREVEVFRADISKNLALQISSRNSQCTGRKRWNTHHIQYVGFLTGVRI